MKKNVAIGLFILMAININSQIEIAGGAGYAYYYGDLNTTNLKNSPATILGESLNMKNFKLSFSLAARHYFPKIFSVGLNFYHLNLAGYDSDNGVVDPSSESYGRQVRNLSFHTAVNAGFLDMQIEPFRNKKSWNVPKLLLSPYVGLGVGFFQFNPKTMHNGSEVELQPLGTEGQGLPGYANKYRLVDIMIPINAGLKVYFPSRRVSLALDFNYNHTFTDYIDDVSTVYPKKIDLQTAYQTSNPAKYALVSALSDPGLIRHADGEIRGHDNYDFFLTGQIKFGYIINFNGRSYYDCYSH